MKRPIIISILSILTLIGSILEIIAGGFMLIGGLLSLSGSSVFTDSPSTTMIFVFGILFLILGIIGIFVSRGLWKGKNWARILYIITGSIGLIISLIQIIINITSISSVLMSIVGMILPVLIISYLLFNKKVESYFK